MLVDSTRRSEMGAAAYACFRASYSEDVVVPRYIALVNRFRSQHASVPSLSMQATPAHV
jgi:hypothetical protein